MPESGEFEEFILNFPSTTLDDFAKVAKRDIHGRTLFMRVNRYYFIR